jgi:hypothetical protein
MGNPLSVISTTLPLPSHVKLKVPAIMLKALSAPDILYELYLAGHLNQLYKI